MEAWESFGNWIIHNILQPTLGKWWAEITAIIVLVIAAIFLVAFAFICVKYKKSISDLDVYRNMVDSYVIKSNKLESSKADLEQELDRVKVQLKEEHGKVESQNVQVDTLQQKLNVLSKDKDDIHKKYLDLLKGVNADVSETKTPKKATSSGSKSKKKVNPVVEDTNNN